MVEVLSDILAQGVEHLNIILLIGLAIFLGTVGAKIFQRLRIPQVIGFIIIGIILGPVLNIISSQAVRRRFSKIELLWLFSYDTGNVISGL